MSVLKKSKRSTVAAAKKRSAPVPAADPASSARGRHVPFPDPEVLITEREAEPRRTFDDLDTEGPQRPFVERATPCDVPYWQRHMIEQAR